MLILAPLFGCLHLPRFTLACRSRNGNLIKKLLRSFIPSPLSFFLSHFIIIPPPQPSHSLLPPLMGTHPPSTRLTRRCQRARKIAMNLAEIAHYTGYTINYICRDFKAILWARGNIFRAPIFSHRVHVKHAVDPALYTPL